jgi:hypothetical protein
MIYFIGLPNNHGVKKKCDEIMNNWLQIKWDIKNYNNKNNMILLINFKRLLYNFIISRLVYLDKSSRINNLLKIINNNLIKKW